MAATHLRKLSTQQLLVIHVFKLWIAFDSYESEDGTKVSESGSQKQVGPKPEDIGTVSKGSYSFTNPDGVVLTVNWVADENGFQATGDHLPTPPPMPEHVVKMLADLKAAGLL